MRCAAKSNKWLRSCERRFTSPEEALRTRRAREDRDEGMMAAECLRLHEVLPAEVRVRLAVFASSLDRLVYLAKAIQTPDDARENMTCVVYIYDVQLRRPGHLHTTTVVVESPLAVSFLGT